VYRARGPYPYRGVTRTTRSRTSRRPGRARDRCVVVEPVQGEGGFIPLPEDFPARSTSLCREHWSPVLDDEVSVRRRPHGPVWAIEHYGAEPDLLVSGKSLAAVSRSPGHRPRRAMDAPSRGASAARSEDPSPARPPSPSSTRSPPRTSAALRGARERLRAAWTRSAAAWATSVRCAHRPMLALELLATERARSLRRAREANDGGAGSGA